MTGRLTEGFRDIIELHWSDFVALEQNPDVTNFNSAITSVARASVKGNLRAIQTAIDRLDGKVANEVEVEYPKFYTLYPKATKTTDDSSIIDLPTVSEKVASEEVLTSGPADLEELESEPEELLTGSLRAVLEKMLNSPKQIVVDILAAVDKVDHGDLDMGDPLVKSVIVAGLMKLVHDGRISAVFEVFDQIDGKVVDKYKVLGDDVFMYNYSEIAPAGAEKNDDGIYQIAADNTTNAWVARLEEKNARKNNR